jgi:fumarate reductase (CoM/CoB) subunit B
MKETMTNTITDANFRIGLDQRSINKCVRCGTCRSVCPVFEELGWESSNTRGRIMIMKSLVNGCRPDANAVASINTCTTCGICTESCPAGVNPVDLVESARRELVSRGVMTAAQSELSKNIFSSGNTFGDSSSRRAWLEDLGDRKFRFMKEKADFVYFVGCMNSYRYTKTAARTVEVLSRFGVALLPDEHCCGSPLMRTGFDARKFKEANTRQIEKMGAHTIITGCAGCYTTLKKSYSKEFKVVSVPEFLAEHISELDLRPLNLTVTYHDPCHLGRHNKVYDPPRRVIEAVCDLKEMKASRQSARCCGGGGGVRAGYKDLSLKMAKRRLQDVPEGVDYIVTSCPLCIRNLSDAGAGEKVIDLVDLVAKALAVESF